MGFDAFVVRLRSARRAVGLPELPSSAASALSVFTTPAWTRWGKDRSRAQSRRPLARQIPRTAARAPLPGARRLRRRAVALRTERGASEVPRRATRPPAATSSSRFTIASTLVFFLEGLPRRLGGAARVCRRRDHVRHAPDERRSADAAGHKPRAARPGGAGPRHDWRRRRRIHGHAAGHALAATGGGGGGGGAVGRPGRRVRRPRGVFAAERRSRPFVL